MQVDAYLIDNIWTGNPHEKGPVMLVAGPLGAHEAVAVPDQNHDAFQAFLIRALAAAHLLLCSTLLVCLRIAQLELAGQVVVRRGSSRGAAHGAARLEVVDGIIVGVERGEVKVETGMGDVGGGGHIGPLGHARGAEQVGAPRLDGGVEEEVADGAHVVVGDCFGRRGGRGLISHGGGGRRR